MNNARLSWLQAGKNLYKILSGFILSIGYLSTTIGLSKMYNFSQNKKIHLNPLNGCTTSQKEPGTLLNSWDDLNCHHEHAHVAWVFEPVCAVCGCLTKTRYRPWLFNSPTQPTSQSPLHRISGRVQGTTPDVGTYSSLTSKITSTVVRQTVQHSVRSALHRDSQRVHSQMPDG